MNFKFKDYRVIPGGICAVEGFTAAGINCGIRQNRSKKDLALIYSKIPCVTAAIYTNNKVKGAPIYVTQDNLKRSGFKTRAIIANSGNANTCNFDGIEKAKQMCQITAQQLNIDESSVVVASTGVIGETLPIEPIKNNIGKLCDSLNSCGSHDAASAIMTTDTREKEYAIEFDIDGCKCHLGVIGKGTGMINPNMGTMLCFITSDVAISQCLLQKALKYAADRTFNMISVDGDTSTNDMVLVMTNESAANKKIECKNEYYDKFLSALYVVMKRISRELAADGEGATKLIECKVKHAKTEKTAQNIAKSVVSSMLLKAAIYGEDANWGRILCAIGYAEGDFEIEKVSVQLASKTKDVMVCKNGMGVDFSEEAAQFILNGDEIKIIVNLHSGEFSATAWGCDLTHDYVKINGEYRT